MDKRKLNRNLIIIGISVCFILVVTMVIQFAMLGIESKRKKDYESEVAKLEQQIDKLQNDIEYKKTLQYIEKYAREQLDLYGDGDVVFIPQA